MTVPEFLSRQHPYDVLSEAVRDRIARSATRAEAAAGETIYGLGAPLAGLHVILSGEVEVEGESGEIVSRLRAGNSFGERGLMRDGRAATTARALEATELLVLPPDLFQSLRETQEPFRRFFERGRAAPRPPDLASTAVSALMAAPPVTCGPETSIAEAAGIMRERRISCLCVTNDGLLGIVTTRDMVGRALAEGADPAAPVSSIMTEDPMGLPPSAIGSDVLRLMAEHRIGHLPVLDGAELAGIVTQTDLIRFQSTGSAGIVGQVARAGDVAALAAACAGLPDMLARLVSAGHRHDSVTRMITDVADVATRRLLALAEARLGPPPAPYLWLACGSQGRQEQTGVSDQDNVIVHADGVEEPDRQYYDRLARFVSEGLAACGYVFCPGDMMATNPRWCQPVSVWREYFAHWIASPSKEAQMLASVMFDLRPIGGDESLWDGLHEETLRRASSNSIFTAHMASNALSQQTPLGLLRGFATLRSGENRGTIDLKHSGVAPVVDLARMYALQGRLGQVNTRARLVAAREAGVVSPSGGRDLIDAYDVVAGVRLEHQARQIREGAAPGNFMAPGDLSDFERSHLRDAFVVIRTMQSALMQGRGVLG